MAQNYRTTITSADTAEGQSLAQRHSRLEIATRGPGFTEITGEIAQWLTQIGASQGLLTAFIAHTSASLVIQENADPSVQADLMAVLDKLAPREAPYRHAVEGPDDMPAHIKAMLTSVSLSIPVVGGQLGLGTWQGVYVLEHRDNPQGRRVDLQFIGTLGT
ncbi:MAG: secondary thiamine-phosphate synthase enzyme YjbQ [Dichotomicrobium sp.]